MIQKYAEIVGAVGCFFLCIIKLCERLTARSIDALRAYSVCVENKFMKPNCYIDDAAGILSFYGTGNWTLTHEPAGYEIKPGELCIDRYELVENNKVLPHFIVPEQEGIEFYDPYGESRTYREGKHISRRIFRRKG